MAGLPSRLRCATLLRSARKGGFAAGSRAGNRDVGASGCALSPSRRFFAAGRAPGSNISGSRRGCLPCYCCSFSTLPPSVGSGGPDHSQLASGTDNVLANDDPDRCVITGYDPQGFDVGNVNARGSILAFPHSYVQWNAKRLEDITLESLALVEVMTPKIDILLIGQGEKFFRPLDPSIQQYFKDRGIAVEAMDTVSAMTTFNILNGEDRSVCAALLKLDPEDPHEAYYSE